MLGRSPLYHLTPRPTIRRALQSTTVARASLINEYRIVRE